MKKAINNINTGIRVVITAALMLVFIVACSNSPKEVVAAFSDISLIPTLHSTKVTTLISDSGVTRYRITTDEWLMYEKAKEPYWYFPKGIYLERFDSLFATDAYIEGDTAYFFKDRQLWELKGNVEMQNIKQEKFNTEQLFWDQKRKKIYSDLFIHIERADHIIEGIGFESNEPMTQYTIRHTQGIFPYVQRTDSVATDTIQQQ